MEGEGAYKKGFNGRWQRRGVGFSVSMVASFFLAYHALITNDISGGVTFFYPAIAFMISFALWFRMWGALGVWAGSSMAAYVYGFPPVYSALVMSSDFVQVLIPLAAYIHTPTPRSLRDIFTKRNALWVFTVPHIVGATWGVFLSHLWGYTPLSEIPHVWLVWVAGNIVACLVLIPLILPSFTESLENSGFKPVGWWCG